MREPCTKEEATANAVHQMKGKGTRSADVHIWKDRRGVYFHTRSGPSHRLGSGWSTREKDPLTYVGVVVVTETTFIPAE